MVVLEIGRVLSEAGISEKEALRALARAAQETYSTRTRGEGVD